MEKAQDPSKQRTLGGVQLTSKAGIMFKVLLQSLITLTQFPFPHWIGLVVGQIFKQLAALLWHDKSEGQ